MRCTLIALGRRRNAEPLSIVGEGVPFACEGHVRKDSVGQDIENRVYELRDVGNEHIGNQISRPVVVVDNGVRLHSCKARVPNTVGAGHLRQSQP